jgi:serine/threonine-protein kinase PknK
MLTVQGWHLELRLQVGAGATSVVWLAEDPTTGTRAAIKVARHLGDGPTLAREAERLLFSSSNALAGLLDLGTLPTGIGSALGVAERAPYVALEWVDGEPLGAVDLGHDRETLALCVARDIGAALEDLHICGVAHGDIKPANIIVEPDGGATLVDLGLSAPWREAGTTPQGITPKYRERHHRARGRDATLSRAGSIEQLRAARRRAGARSVGAR